MLAEVFKNGGDALQTCMHRIFNAAWRQGRMQEAWKKAIICPIYQRKGDKADYGSYRGILLLRHSTKIYKRTLEQRLRNHIEQKLGEWQHGFRPNRSTSDLILNMKMILEKTWNAMTKPTWHSWIKRRHLTGYRDRNRSKQCSRQNMESHQC